MRGVILEGHLYGHTGGESETVRVFLELDLDTLHARRAYGERASILTLDLDAVEAALAALKHEAARKPPAPLPGQTELDVEADA
jgi:hypothetical protein